MKTHIKVACLATLVFQGNSLPLHAEDSNNWQYKTREEKREAAQRYEITEWLSVSALAELDQINQRFRTADGGRAKAQDFLQSTDIELVAEAAEKIAAEVVFEFDDEKGKFDVDEAVAIFDLEPLELELGKLYLPVGEYYSHFITGSAVEFAETRANGVVATYKPKADLELALFAWDGEAEKVDAASNVDWGVSVQMTPAAAWTLGAGYFSDLADAREIDLDETENRYDRRVDGIGIYGVYALDDFEITAEYSGALKTFREFDSDRNAPSAWNIEFAHYPAEKFEWALRLAGSDELEDAPEMQAGVAASWHVHKKVSLSLEYLYNRYKSGLAENDDEELLESSRQLGGRITLLF